MLDAKDCLARANDMERRAGSCGSARLETDLLSAAATWRYLAQQALWQDAFAAQTVQDSGRD
ncbi:hypothetical protein ASD21_07460 [Caulobacter sp. Root1455]|uniref:hypothetical protein n=1 Tax=unclassified Caulobacter TaxID=2648921 RepID=UPI0006F30F45|nr:MULTISPECIES: hypothetical protein [unclassified Caulobacter]KQY30902.1 hypothetical protein ASD38_05935 [Caulobacter sp. Root487D2Y]KQY95195.1 hypothetical protein ASD21_07460 [Caulobacter sp. Root1455]